MKVNDIICGFKVCEIREAPEYRGRAIYLEHVKTGSQVLKLLNDDRENFFSFAFRTPPENHKGIPHILEHTVLCGSESYPLKDPFVLLHKGSMQTYLNAMTYPDRTVYPGASVVRKDYFNMMSVYADAVFFPLLKEEAFRQEGHRLDWDEKGRLQRIGVVYNEMKGNYSSQESVAAEWTIRSLFSDSPYSWDSGGDPEYIPELDYDEFTAFYRRWYHPTHAMIFLYGDISLEENLELLEKRFLSRFEKAETLPLPQKQARWTEPVLLERPWACEESEMRANNCVLSLNWLSRSVIDSFDRFSLAVLSSILLRDSGSPLYKAILESEWGDDLSPISGLETDLNEMVFSVAVRGAKQEDRDGFGQFVLDELERLAEKGIPEDLIEGTIRTTEFRSREIRGGSPFGLRLMSQIMKGWCAGGSPFLTFETEKWIKQLRDLPNKSDYFSHLIRTELLENPHRTLVAVYPDAEALKTRNKRYRDKLDQLAASLNDNDVEKLKESNRYLQEFQELEDSPEAVASIPFLEKEEIPREVIRLSGNELIINGIPVIHHNEFTNGISYLDLVFDLRTIEPELQPWLPLFCRLLTALGAGGMSAEELSRQISLQTGGVHASLEASLKADCLEPTAFLYFRVKMLSSLEREAVRLALSILEESDFEDQKKLKEIFLEMRNDFKSSIVPQGSSYASLRSSCTLTASQVLEENWYGLSQLFFLESILSSGNEKEFPGDEISEKMKQIASELLNKEALTINTTSETDHPEALIEPVLEILRSWDSFSLPEKLVPGKLIEKKKTAESFSLSAQVGYVALSSQAPRFGTREYAAGLIITHLLKNGYFWDTIRLKGGAYGASAVLSGIEGFVTYSSYRDPQVLATLEAFREGLEDLIETIDEQDLKLALIAVIGKELRPMSPAAKGLIHTKRLLFNIDDELRQKRRDDLLDLSLEEIITEAQRWIDNWSKSYISVLAGDKVLTKAGQTIPELASPVRRIPQ